MVYYYARLYYWSIQATTTSVEMVLTQKVKKSWQYVVL